MLGVMFDVMYINLRFLKKLQNLRAYIHNTSDKYEL